MAKNSWELKINGHDELLVRMERYSSESERLINEALKSKGSDIAVIGLRKKFLFRSRFKKRTPTRKNSRPLKDSIY